jgi:hypothetical protein
MMSEVCMIWQKLWRWQALYHDHCPMYNEKKGCMWLSELKEVKNPYFGAEMPTCGTIEEVIK